MSLIARTLEAEGLPTLILGSAHDILTVGKAPRVEFLNYPLGFTSGVPFDEVNQLAVVQAALEGFDRHTQPAFNLLDFEWPAGWEMIRQRNKGAQDADQRSSRDLTPRYQTEADRIRAEGG